MLALSSLPLSLCLSQPMLRTAPTYARARPAVALLTELPPGFETLMPAVVHHTPFSRHLFNAIMGYMALDTTLFAAKIIKRRMEPGVQEANRLAAAPTTKFGALPPRPVPTLFPRHSHHMRSALLVGASPVFPCRPLACYPEVAAQASHLPPLARPTRPSISTAPAAHPGPDPPNPRPARHGHHPTRRPCPTFDACVHRLGAGRPARPVAPARGSRQTACGILKVTRTRTRARAPARAPALAVTRTLILTLTRGHTLHLCRGGEAIGYASIERSLDFSEHYGARS